MITFFLNLLPLGLVSRLPNCITSCSWRWFKNSLIRIFIKAFKIDINDANRQDINQYQNFNDFFTRELKADARPNIAASNIITSPVDGSISQFGDIKQGQLLQAKKIFYNVTTLLGGDTQDAAPFQDGQFITLYLAPKDYHRVHMPITAKLNKMIYVPGQLFTVSPWGTQKIPQLFTRNERVVCLFESAIGPIAMVLVGALFVGSIKIDWHGVVNAKHPKQRQHWDYPTDAINLQRHQQIGQFQYGSTVIVLLPKQSLQWHSKLNIQQSIKLGDPLGSIN